MIVDGDLASRRFIAAYRKGDRLTGALSVGMPPKAIPCLALRHRHPTGTVVSVGISPATPTPHIMCTGEAAGQAAFAVGSRIATHST